MPTRRDLLQSFAGLSLASVSMPLCADPLGLPIGCQTYPVRDMIAKDFPGTIRLLAQSGFRSIELCSPWGYADSGFAPVGKYRGAELRKLLNGIGVQCFSSHFDIKELRESLPARLAWAKDTGMTQMFVPSLDGPKNPTMDDVKRAADGFNKIGEQTAQAGVQPASTTRISRPPRQRQTYLRRTPSPARPKLVKFQFQVSTIADGFDAADYFTRYPGRFISMHVQGWSSKDPQNRCGGPGQSRLETDLHCRPHRRCQKLLRRDGPSAHAGQRSLPASPESLSSPHGS